jgi:two-component system, chemotaxis family, response regulator Rcp1
MSNHGRGEQIEILLIEDCEDHANLTIEALGEGKVRYNVSHVEDGVEAIAFLHRQGKYRDAPRPDLILLSLNLPRKGGHEVLEEVKSDQALKRIPVVMLTASNDEQDMIAALDKHANCYIVKPPDLEEFKQVVRSIGHFWFRVVKLV